MLPWWSQQDVQNGFELLETAIWEFALKIVYTPGVCFFFFFFFRKPGSDLNYLGLQKRRTWKFLKLTFWIVGTSVFIQWKVKKVKVKVALCDCMYYTVHGILQARILEWVVFPFSRGSSKPRDRTQVSCIADSFFTSWATREAQQSAYLHLQGEILEQSFCILQRRFLPWESDVDTKSLKNARKVWNSF